MSGSYLTFAARRVAAALLIAVLVSAITFVMLHILRPESFFDPRPLPTQLGDYLWSAFTQFDLGTSYQPPFRPVGDLIRERIWVDFALFAGAAAFGIGAGVAGGVVCARFPRSLRAHALSALATFALCAPVYWVGLFTLLLFGNGIGRVLDLGVLVDTGTYEPLTTDPLAWLGSLLVPWMVAGAPLAAICLRLTASTMRDVGDADFVRTALGKGLSERRVAFRHSLPAAAAPTVSFAGAYTPLLVGNALLVEQVFNIPGVFRYTSGAVSNGDFPLLQGMVLVGAVLVVLGNLVADLVLARLDPRVRTQ
jgi:ABC-type dipeptide/oligopeptide/nickel transport system permease component